MITRKFITKVHDAFDELNYHETECLDFDNFRRAARNTLNRCEDVQDAANAIRMFRFCVENFAKIEKMFDKKRDIFNEYSYEGNSLLSLVPEESAYGTYYVTNGLDKKTEQIFFTSCSFDDDDDDGVLYSFEQEKGKIIAFSGDYYMRYSRMSATKMNLYNKDDECICNIVLSPQKNLGIFLENNISPYDLVLYDDYVGIYDRKYIADLAPNDEIDPEKMIADIEWDLIEEKTDLGVAKINVYELHQELEILLLFGGSTFLLAREYWREQKRARARENARFGMAMSRWSR